MCSTTTVVIAVLSPFASPVTTYPSASMSSNSRYPLNFKLSCMILRMGCLDGLCFIVTRVLAFFLLVVGLS
ncbi:hypothetical protein LINGRAHAP2_LOCUS5196 [Linum grandiflorum]